MADVKWKSEPDPKDYKAALSYLSLICDEADADKTVEALKSASLEQHPAKDILRSSRLPLLPRADASVARHMKKIADGKKLSPILAVRGDNDEPLTVADGYHRTCAVYHVNEDGTVDARVGSWRK